MSLENAKTVRDAVQALNHRDIGAFVACLHPEVEWEETADAFPGLSGSYRGRDEVQRWAEQAVVEYWAELEMEIEEITETSGGGILLGMRISARGTASGVDTETHAWQFFGFVGGRISRRLGPFWERDGAFEAAPSPQAVTRIGFKTRPRSCDHRTGASMPLLKRKDWPRSNPVRL